MPQYKNPIGKLIKDIILKVIDFGITIFQLLEKSELDQ